MKFSYFPGCTDHSTSYEYGRSTHEVFKTLGVDLVEIEDWNCCGAAATHSINHLLSLCLPARNISKAQAAQAGPLVVPCAGCFNMLKRAEHALQNDETKRKEIEGIVEFTYDPSLEILALIDVILNRVGLEKIHEKVKKPLKGLKPACYYGCALVRHPKVTRLDDPENPQYMDRLMKAIGAEPVEWSYKVDCCGADLALTYGKVVQKMVGKIVAMAKEAGAQCIVTSCGLCQANLEMRQDVGLPIFYFTELMGVAFDSEKKNTWWKKHMISPKGLLESLGLT
ncbi:MAG: CoB--CoM heterodisulfide reductase iron-sulfur subunit B family protein [Deltaproteobacteria bacterium]|nr:CoB--CoM heterodisulfide reductase iron-sulfur subunit B family protein [Deltaproteobacteria bacterium]